MKSTDKLISVDAFFKRICGDTSIRGSAFAAIRRHIYAAPAVEAKEVVHGRWVDPYMNRYGHPCHCCSICGFKASYQDRNYCPNCGAKMDGGNDDGVAD